MVVIAYPFHDQALNRANERVSQSYADFDRSMDLLSEAINNSPMDDALKKSALNDIESLRSSVEKLLTLTVESA